jgi:glycosyltransferase involved in cell wall biosynthesis
MKIAILTSGILPVPSVQGGAVETLVDHYLEYNDQHQLHDITVFSVYHPAVLKHPALRSEVNHYQFIDTSSVLAKVQKHIHGLTHRETYYHYSIDFFLRKALKSIDKSEFDCIILENRPGYALQLQAVTKANLVYHLHNDFLNDTTRDGQALYQVATKIITVSDYITSRVRTCSVDDQKCVTVYNGIDLNPFSATSSITREKLGYDKEDFVLAFSGRLIPEKGILELVEALTLLKDEPRIRLLVMGSSFYDTASSGDPFLLELKTRAKEMGDRIRFTGYVKHEAIPDYLRLADVAVIPSIWEEPFGLTVAEGMAAGLPIITTHRGGIPEMVTDRNAIVIPTDGDFTGHLANAIRSLYHDQEGRRKMGEVSKQLSGNYSKELYAKHFLDAIAVTIQR